MVTNTKEYMRNYQRRRRAKLKALSQNGTTTVTVEVPPRPQPTPATIPVKKEEPRTATVHTGHLKIEQPLQPEPIRESVKPETLKFFEALYNHFFGKKKKQQEIYEEPKI